MDPAHPQPRRDDALPDTTLFWRWVGKATRPVVGWALIAVGAIAIVVGYFGVANEAIVAKQLPYLVSGGIGGMVLVAVGAFLLGTEDLRKDLRRIDELERMVGDLHGVLLAGARTIDLGASRNGRRARAGGADQTATDTLVALPRGKSFHRAGCSMVEGKDARAVGRAEVRERGLQPCSLCEPAAVAV